MKIKLQSVIPGSADVMCGQHFIGHVAHSASARGWWAYGLGAKRISEYPNHTRSAAVREVVAACRSKP